MNHTQTFIGQPNAISECFLRLSGIPYDETPSLNLRINKTDVDGEDAVLETEHTILPAAQAYQVLSMDLPGTLTADINVTTAKGQDKVTPKLKALTLDLFLNHDDMGTCIANDSRKFDADTAIIGEGSITVQKHLQGQGIGNTLLRNQIALFIILGATTFSGSTGFQNGGYTWAKLLLPSDDVPECKNIAKERLEVLYTCGLIPISIYLDLAKIIEFKDPEDMWRLADYKFDLTDNLAHLLARDDINEGNFVYHFLFKQVFDNAHLQGKPIHPARLLLTGTAWKGHLDLTNPDHLKRAADVFGIDQSHPFAPLFSP